MIPASKRSHPWQVQRRLIEVAYADGSEDALAVVALQDFPSLDGDSPRRGLNSFRRKFYGDSKGFLLLFNGNWALAKVF